MEEKTEKLPSKLDLMDTRTMILHEEIKDETKNVKEQVKIQNIRIEEKLNALK